MAKTNTASKTQKARGTAAAEFEALPDAEKDRIYAEVDREAPNALKNSRPLNTKERAQWKRFKKKLGRPKIGKGAKMIALSVELDLLKHADRYAKAHKMKRSQLFAKGLRAVIGLAS